MKGIVLAAGTGSRLWPITKAVGKQLLPVYDKPLVFYPISTLMLSGVRDILLITTHLDLPRFKDLLGDGAHLGVSFHYEVQAAPRGILEALVIGREFLSDSNFALTLGDNIFHGSGLRALLASVVSSNSNTIFAHKVSQPREYGVVELGENNAILSIEEKPATPRSDLAVPGLYFYRNDILDLIETIQPSARGELEITSLNQALLDLGKLSCQLLPRGSSWFDAGTPDALLEASTYIQSLQRREGRKVACLEEVALEMGFIMPSQLSAAADRYGRTPYGNYIRDLCRTP